jgi:molecular chaperone GrpE
MSAEPKKPEVEDVRAPESGESKVAGGSETGDAIAELQAKADENWDRYVRAAAELENVRKRAQRDVENAHRFALENFGKELLAVVDSLEMGLEAAESADAAALRNGSEATCKLLKSTMERFGVTEVDPEGEPFDPEYHEAMSMMPSANAEPGSVLTVIQKGYTLNGRLLRPARVIVAAEMPVADPAK